MRTEVPVFKRCFCCLPLRRGVLLWGYLKLIFSGFLILANVFDAILIVSIRYYHHNALDFVRFFIAFAALIMCFAVNLHLIVAAHKKSSHLLKRTYMWELVTVVTVFVLAVSNSIIDVITYWKYLTSHFWNRIIFMFLIQLIYVGLQLYIIVSIRSEVIKLESKHEFRFVNNAAEAECKYYENSPPVEHTISMQEKKG